MRAVTRSGDECESEREAKQGSRLSKLKGESASEGVRSASTSESSMIAQHPQQALLECRPSFVPHTLTQHTNGLELKLPNTKHSLSFKESNTKKRKLNNRAARLPSLVFVYVARCVRACVCGDRGGVCRCAAGCSCVPCVGACLEGAVVEAIRLRMLI